MALIEDIIEENLQNAVDVHYETISMNRDEPVYFHDQLMRPEYSPGMTYESVGGDTVRVVADVVAFDSPLPIKKRDSIKSANGDLVKIGMKFLLSEKEMNIVHQLQRTPGAKALLAEKLFKDSDRVMYGMKELLDKMLLSALSEGVMLVPEDENTGTAVRVSYDMSDANKFGATYQWNDSRATPISDMKRVMKEARDSRSVNEREIWLDVQTMEALLSNKEVKERYSFLTHGIVGDSIPMLSEDMVKLLFSRELKANINVIDRSFTVEKNKKRTIVPGWAPGQVVFTPSKDLGKLFWALSAEDESRTPGVIYAKPNNYMLIGVSQTSEPVSKKTFGQAIALPVLQDVDSIYYLDTTEGATDVQTEGDANFDYAGDSYTRVSVIYALNEASKKSLASSANTDAELLEKVNRLSENQIVIFEANIVEA